MPPMKAAVLKKSALATLTSRTRPDDCRVNRVFVTAIAEPSPSQMPAWFARNLQPIGLFVKDASGRCSLDPDVTNDTAPEAVPSAGPTLADPLAEALRLVELATGRGLQVRLM